MGGGRQHKPGTGGKRNRPSVSQTMVAVDRWHIDGKERTGFFASQLCHKDLPYLSNEMILLLDVGESYFESLRLVATFKTGGGDGGTIASNLVVMIFQVSPRGTGKADD